MKQILKPFLCLVLLANCIFLRAQDIHFSQFYESPLTLNPALCGGFEGDLRAEANYRSQWAGAMGSTDGFNTIAASVEYRNIMQKWRNGFLSTGLSFYNDKSGTAQISMTDVNFTTASGVYLSEHSSIIAGLQAGWSQHSIDLQNVPWGEQYINGQYDPNASSGEPSMGNTFSYFDFSSGLLYRYIRKQSTLSSNNHFKLDLGAAVFHVNQPNMSYYGQTESGTQLYMRFVFHGSADFGIPSAPISIVPGFIFFRQGPAQEINVGGMIRYIPHSKSMYSNNVKESSFSIGAYYRWNDATILMMEMEFASYAIGISYDINTSDYVSATSGEGAFEISIRFINAFSSHSSSSMY
jgi:type IX secretion system PorP/SprF family membrane protein